MVELIFLINDHVDFELLLPVTGKSLCIENNFLRVRALKNIELKYVAFSSWSQFYILNRCVGRSNSSFL